MKLFWKYIDKFLKVIKTDRNTFFTYLLTLITVYFCVDRIVEVLFMCFSGISVDYWGPFMYTFAIACPVFAFLFSGGSKFATDDAKKFQLFTLYCIGLYIIGISMLVQWLNKLCWILLFSVPNYVGIVTNFMDLIKPAFTALACYIPLMTFYPFFRKIYTSFADTKDIRDSIADYNGINLADTKQGWGQYTCEMFICKDGEFGKTIKIPECRRFESTLIVGNSGSGKTTMAFEPMIARDIEKKYFFREASKELGFTALRTGLATLSKPYNNDYINANFSLNMLSISPGREKLFNAFLKDLIYFSSGSSTIYKNLGLTYIAPDYESVSHIIEVLDNYGMKYNLVDPNNEESIGLNPFVFRDTVKTALAISAVLKRMYETNNVTPEEAFMQNITSQAIENLSLLLKEVYPTLHEGMLPNLEDLLKMLNDFELVENFCEELKKDPELAEKYNILLTYFKNNFYKDAIARADTQKALQAASSQLENLLRFPGVRNILCNRTYNIDFDQALANGEVTIICTRRGDVGSAVNKAFGLFTLLLMQQSIISRPGNEKTRIPHFLYIDEFPPFVCKATEDFFTLFRKYRVGMIISAQNLSQFGTENGPNYRQTILANCTTKIVFGNNTPEDNKWWEEEFGDKREWQFSNTYNTDTMQYDAKYGSIKWGWTKNFKAGKVQSQKFKAIIFKTKDVAGKMVVGKGKLDFLESKYKEKHPVKIYNFAKYSGNAIQSDNETNADLHSVVVDSIKSVVSSKFVPSEFGDNDDPIQYNSTDMKYFFENGDAISFNLVNDKKDGNNDSKK